MRNHNFIAETALGDCPLCSLRIDAGEWASKRENGRLIHLGCVSRISAVPVQTQFSLISDNDLETAIEAKNETVERAKQTLGIKHFSFDGASALGIDLPRLAGQLARVFDLMRDGQFRKLTDIASKTGCLETSASSRLRDFRKARFGGHTVVSRQVAGSPGTHEYKLVLRKRSESDGQRNAA